MQIYFFCVKRQAKNDFLKDVESTVVIGLRKKKKNIFIFPQHKWLQNMPKLIGSVVWRQILKKFHVFKLSEIFTILLVIDCVGV